MSHGDNDIIEIRGRDVKLVGLALICMLVTIGLLAFSLILTGNQLVRVEDQASRAAASTIIAAETHHGVCVFRQSLQQQIKDSQEYLIHHPNGAPSLGITAAQIEQGIQRQEVAVAALSDLHCASS